VGGAHFCGRVARLATSQGLLQLSPKATLLVRLPTSPWPRFVPHSLGTAPPGGGVLLVDPNVFASDQMCGQQNTSLLLYYSPA